MAVWVIPHTQREYGREKRVGFVVQTRFSFFFLTVAHIHDCRSYSNYSKVIHSRAILSHSFSLHPHSSSLSSFFFPALRSGGGACLPSLMPMPTAMPVAAPCPACYTAPGPTLAPHVHAMPVRSGWWPPPSCPLFSFQGRGFFFWKISGDS